MMDADKTKFSDILLYSNHSVLKIFYSASEGRVISESECQKGRVIPLCKLFKGRVTHLFQNFLMKIFMMLLSIFLTD